MSPDASVTCTPKFCIVCSLSRLCNLVKIVLNELPITAPPLEVFCCTALTIPANSSKLTPACPATAPARLKASARSLSDTAAFLAASENLLTTCALVIPDFLNPLIAEVKPATASAAP